MKQRGFQAVLLLTTCLMLTSCFGSNQGLALKRIEGKKITFLYGDSHPDFKQLAGKELLYTFYPNLTYEAFIDKKPFIAGNYAYNKTGPDSAELSISYAVNFDIQTQTLYLLFDAPGQGKFDEISSSKDMRLSAGTFTVLE